MAKRSFFLVPFVLFLILSLSFFQTGYAKSDNAKLDALLSNKSDSWVYFVQMDLDPAISYKGGIQGYSATKPPKGRKLNVRSQNVRKYRGFLESKHNAALKAVGVSVNKKIYDFSAALNGFAVNLSESQSRKLAKQAGVVRVLADVIRHKTGDNTPVFLGLTDAAGPWVRGLDGEDVVVGIIDSGIWPEHPSFTDSGDYGPSPLAPLDDTRPNCEFGNIAHNVNDVAFKCNNKLLGARQMLDTYRFFIGAESHEYNSARDENGHGTHTASTAAGKRGVSASIFGIPRGSVSGVAPRARVIAYKGLGDLGGFSSDLAAAIDQAVADGVDVINFSIGGGASLDGADDIAFLFASSAGVFVAASAGNAGPEAATIGGPASVPWLTSVAASSQNRAFISDISLSGPGIPPSGVWGGSVTAGIDHFDLVDADAMGDGSNGECLQPFPAGSFKANDAVLCNRYTFGVGRSTRVANVAAGGAGAVLFVNATAMHPNMTPTDNHSLPTVHILKNVGQPLKDYLLANPGQVQVSFTQSSARYQDDPRVLPTYMASFSSRGPDPVAMNIIKPDITAPGINILAGASPIHAGTAAQGEYFQAIMGTSMSGPQVAGIFALIKQAHPDWTAAMAKSALMTTAYQEVLKEDYLSAADPFDMGAGHVNPNGKANKGSLFEPGLVYDAGFFQYLGFLCDEEPGVFANPDSTCGFLNSQGVPIKAVDLNLPSIGVAQLAGRRTVKRTVTSVAKEAGWRTYRVAVDAPAGYDISVSPSSLNLRSGETASYEVTMTNINAPIDQWRFGSLTWRSEHYEVENSDSQSTSPGMSFYDVRSPIAVRAALFAAIDQIDGSGQSGNAGFEVSFGYTGGYSVSTQQLKPADVISDSVLQDPDQIFDPGDGFSKVHSFDLSDVALLRIAMPPDAVASPDVDLDIFVFDPDDNLVASSVNGGTDELINIDQPKNGTWRVFVHGWQTIGASSDYRLYSWSIQNAPDSGPLVITSAPSAATIGAVGRVEIQWSNVSAGLWSLGAVSHRGDAGLIGLTLINIDNR